MKQKKTESPISKYINNQISSDQSLKIKDISSPKCQKEKMTLRFYSLLDDRTIKRGLRLSILSMNLNGCTSKLFLTL
jgi:hypothetical protein